jgi:hypothetical protein
MTKRRGNNTTKNQKNAPKQTSAQKEKASFRNELASRIESAHKAAQYERSLTREDIEISLGVGDYDAFFKEFTTHFQNSRFDTLTKEEAAMPKLKIKELSKLRWRKPRRVSRGKINKGNSNV